MSSSLFIRFIGEFSNNLALENELKGVDLLGMSSVAPLYSYLSGCLHGILKVAPVPAGFRDLL